MTKHRQSRKDTIQKQRLKLEDTHLPLMIRLRIWWREKFPPKTQKQLSSKEFDRKIRIWTVVVPLVVCVMSTVTAIGVAYFASRAKVEYQIPIFDRIDVNKLSSKITTLTEKYFATNDKAERDQLDQELRIVAEEEARIMRKYNPDYRTRWPIVSDPPNTTGPGYFNEGVSFLIVLLTFLSTLIARYVLGRKYDVDAN